MIIIDYEYIYSHYIEKLMNKDTVRTIRIYTPDNDDILTNC